ncbi:hypothetical protein Q9L58_010092 [Maublancomyces gigas]|uniref:Uncharacterized protein n=1 Tax=Discina gigas TaxID=1032678 RepID=A0ABR3G5B4_9PEZI
MSFRGFTPINTPDSLQRTSGRPPPDPPESPSLRKNRPESSSLRKNRPQSPILRKNTLREKKELSKAATLTPGINPSYLKLREEHGQEQALDILINRQVTVEAKCTVAMEILNVVQNVTEEIGGVEEAMWERVIEKNQLWGPMGGKEQVKEIMEYESQAGVRIAQRKEEGGRKRRARETLGQIWGDGWEERFDPDHKKLQQASEHTLQNLAARAREGWRIEVVKRSVDDAFKARIKDRRQGLTARPGFIRKDTEDGAKSLKRAETESGKRKEDVTLEDLELFLPGRLTNREPSPPSEELLLRSPRHSSPQREPEETRHSSPQQEPEEAHPSSRDHSPPRPEQKELHLPGPQPNQEEPRLPEPGESRPSSSSLSPCPSSHSGSVIIIDNREAHPGMTAVWDFDRRCFFYAVPGEPRKVDADGAMALVSQGYAVEQFGLDEVLPKGEPENEPPGPVPGEVLPQSKPARRRRKARTSPSGVRRSGRISKRPGKGSSAV